MARLRVIVSSTAYDLGVLRSSMKRFIEELGFDAILSEYSDIPYDFREATHRSCLKEVETCDMLVLIIGSRFGSEISDEEVATLRSQIDIADLEREESEWTLSITQAEALTAVARGIPVFPFVESSVNHDYETYRRNRDQPFAGQIKYASISKQGTAGYIFGFIELLKKRERNNALFVFDKIDEIYETLLKQWSGLFQRLLSEARGQQREAVRIRRLEDQFEELKALILSMVGTGQQQIARAALRFRRLVVFLEGLPKADLPMSEAVSRGDLPWARLLTETAGITLIDRYTDQPARWASILHREGAKSYLCELDLARLDQLAEAWADFVGLDKAERETVYEELRQTVQPSELGLLAAASAASSPGSTRPSGRIGYRPGGLREREIDLSEGEAAGGAATEGEAASAGKAESEPADAAATESAATLGPPAQGG
jgi:hypothetical protein